MELSRMAPIPIVNTLLKTLCDFGGKWREHSYLDSPKYNEKTNNILNRLPLLVLTCWQCDDIWNVGSKMFFLSVVLLWLLIVIDMCYFLPIDQEISNEGRLCYKISLLIPCSKLENALYIFLTDSKIVRKIMRNDT